MIVTDGPTALSAAETGRLFDVIQALSVPGAAVLFISHRLEEVRTWETAARQAGLSSWMAGLTRSNPGIQTVFQSS